MKKVTVILLFLFAICSIGCRKKHVEPYGYVWYEVQEEGLYGAEDEHGKILLPCMFNFPPQLETCSISYVDEFALTPCKNNYWKWIFKDNNGNKLGNMSTWESGLNHEVRYSVSVDYSDTIEYYNYRVRAHSTAWKMMLFDSNFYMIYEGYINWPISCSYNNNSWRYAGDMSELVMYTFEELYDNDVYRVYINKEGETIIPACRKYRSVFPQMIDNHCFYLVIINNDLMAVLNTQGTELFRYNKDLLQCAYIHTSEAKDDRHYDANIDSREWTKAYGKTAFYGHLTYDSQYGFGIIEPWKEFPGEIWDDGYDSWYEHYNEHPDIFWTHIMLPAGSETFDVTPSYDNRIAPTLNLAKIASKY